mgnify:CR=1 FL=1
MHKKHLSHSGSDYEFTPPAELLDPEQIPALVRALVEKLGLKDPTPRANAPPARVCTGCEVEFEGLYADPVCTNCWMVAR